MDKETLSNYGWIVVLVLVLAVMLALATPFGSFIAGAIKSTTAGLFSVNQAALGSAGIDVNDMVFENCDHVETEIRNATDTYTGDTCCKACGAVLQAGQTVRAKVPEGGKYTAADGTVYNPGDEMPEVVTTGDTYEYQKYIYKYNQRKNANNGQWETYEPQNGWGVGTVSAGGVKDWGKMLSSINGAPIVSLRRTFGYKTDMIVTPEIPESVTDMYMAFWNCTKITNAPTIPNGIVNLDETFKGCTALTSLPDLSNCTKLTSLKWTFSGCTSITDASDFVIPSGVTNLYDTFQGTGLVNDGMPTIPTTVTTLYETFASCKSLTDLSGFTIPNSVTSLEHTFRFCTSLVKTPTIPNSVTNMSRTFQNCTSLSDNGLPILPNSVTNIHQAFQECAVVDLSDYVIPNSVTNMDDAFSSCKSLIKAPVIPSSVINLSGAFSNCPALTTIPVIPNGVKEMNYTFQNCTSLTDLSGYVLPGSVKYLKNTFRGCTSLTKAPVITECTQSEKHQYLENTFYGCTSLTTIPTLPKTVGTIKGAFYGCTSLTGTITFNLGHPYLTSASYYTDCFAGVDFEAQNLSLDGTSTHIDGIGATGLNYCAECNGCCKGGH